MEGLPNIDRSLANVDVAGALGPSTPVWAMTADTSVSALLHRVQRIQVSRENPDLDHVSGLAVAAVSRGNADDGLTIKWAWAFMQQVSLLLRQGF